MSYILDALKKSEQEHQKGRVPGLGTSQGLPGPGGRFETDRLILIYGLATVLIAVLGVGSWLYLRKPAAAPETAPVAATRPPVPAETVTTAPRIPPPPARAQRKPAAAPRPPTAGQPLPTQATPSTPGGGKAQLKAVKPELPSPAAPATVVEKSQPTPPRVEEIPPEPAEIAAAAAPEVQVKPELLPPVPMEELPAETRAELPPIKIGAHLFSDTPASRRVSLNGRLMREGEQIAKDLVLVEIIRQGVILSFRGRQFTMPVFPR